MIGIPCANYPDKIRFVTRQLLFQYSLERKAYAKYRDRVLVWRMKLLERSVSAKPGDMQDYHFRRAFGAAIRQTTPYGTRVSPARTAKTLHCWHTRCRVNYLNCGFRHQLYPPPSPLSFTFGMLLLVESE